MRAAVDRRQDRTRSGTPYLNFPERKETAFLVEAHSQPLQQALKDLGRAYTNFFKGQAAFPCFKKRGRRDSFRYPQPKPGHIDQTNRRVFLPKIGWVRYPNSRAIKGTPKNLTVALEAGEIKLRDASHYFRRLWETLRLSKLITDRSVHQWRKYKRIRCRIYK